MNSSINRYSSGKFESATVTATSEVVQLQLDLSKKNMFFSKELIEFYKVIGQGKYVSEYGVCSTIPFSDHDAKKVAWISEVS